jgi:hypothetical protein
VVLRRVFLSGGAKRANNGQQRLPRVGLVVRHEIEGPKQGAPVTAIGFASIDVEMRTELEKRVLCALQGEPL